MLKNSIMKTASIILSVLLINSLGYLNVSAEEEIFTEYNSTGSYESFIYPTTYSLGSVNNFAVFAKEYDGENHMEGNIAVNLLDTAINIGNSEHETISKSENNLSYINEAKDDFFTQSSNSIIQSANPLILGSDFNVYKSSQSDEWYLGSSSNSPVKIGTSSDISDIFTDENNLPYINFDTAFSNLSEYAQNLSSQDTTTSLTNDGVGNYNCSCSSGLNIIEIDSSILSSGNQGSINFENLNQDDIIIVNITNLDDSNIEFNKPIKINNQNSSWVEDNSRVIFNLNDYNKAITFSSTTKGIILAPNANVIITETHDGSIIAPFVSNINSEIHKTPFSEPTLEPDFEVSEAGATLQIKKVDSQTNAVITTGAEFSLFSDSDCCNCIATAITDTSGIATFSNLTGTDYRTIYLKETTPPTGYNLNDTVYTLTLTSSIATYLYTTPQAKITTWKINNPLITDGVLTIENTLEDVTSDDVTSDDVTSDDVTSDDVTSNEITEVIEDYTIPVDESIPIPETEDTNNNDILYMIIFISAVCSITFFLSFIKNKKLIKKQ